MSALLSVLRHGLEVVVKEGGLKRLIQFGLVGLTGVGVNMGTFVLLREVAHLYDLVAIVLAVGASIVSNFVLNDIWTFRDKRVGRIDATLARAWKFALVSLGATAIYYGIYTPLTRLLDVYELLAYAIAIGVGTIWNFSVNVLWTWRTRVEKSSDL